MGAIEGMLAVSESRATQVPAPSLDPTTDLYSDVGSVLLNLECSTLCERAVSDEGSRSSLSGRQSFRLQRASGPKLIGVEYDSATNMSLPLLVTLKPPFSNIRLFQQDAGESSLAS